MYQEQVFDRTRTDTHSEAVVKWNRQYLYANGTERKAGYTSSYVPTKIDRSISDTPTPRYKEKSAKGIVINNDLKQEITTFRQHGGRFENYNKPENWWDSGGITATWLVPKSITIDPLLNQAVVSNADIDLAVSSAFAKAARNEASALVTLAEGQKTIDSVVDIIYRLLDILRALKYLQLDELIGQLRPSELADRYLELRYAIRPLLIDANQIASAIQAETLHDRFTSRGFKFINDFRTTSGSHNTYASMGVNWRASLSHTAEVRAGCLNQYNTGRINDTLTIWGADQLAMAALELTPFSFIVGWFFNLGDFVLSWSPKAGITTLSSWATVHEQIVARCEIVDAFPRTQLNAPASDRYCIAEGWYETTIQRRTRYAEVGRPLIPRLDVNLDFYKLADILLIAKGIFLK